MGIFDFDGNRVATGGILNFSRARCHRRDTLVCMWLGECAGLARITRGRKVAVDQGR